MQRHVGGAGQVARGAFVIAAHVQHDVARADVADRGEGDPGVVAAVLAGCGERVQVAGGRTGGPVDADADQLPLRGGDLPGTVADQRDRGVPGH